jgi:hypothetical protein
MAEEGELETITLFKLLNAYKRTLEKYKNKNEKVVHTNCSLQILYRN